MKSPLNLKLPLQWAPDERGKRGFSCYKQKVKSSGSSPQLCAKGSKGRMTKKGNKSD